MNTLKETCTSHFLIVRTVNCKKRLFLLILYKAIQSFLKFAGHLEGIVVDVEPSLHPEGTEVRRQRAVVPAGDGDVLALEHIRVALVRPGHRLHERIVILSVASEQASIILTQLCDAVCAQERLQVHAEIRVDVPTLKVGLF